MAKVEVAMPKMGESITEGTVIEWYKKPGDAVDLDESLLEIGTDKVDTDVPSPGAGILSEILVPEGETVDVGTVIAVIETDGDVAAETAGNDASHGDLADDSSDVANAGKSVTMDVLMPKMGESIVEGTVLEWHKNPGDSVDLDEPLLEIATDKVDTEVPSPAAGTLQQILVSEGETVDVGTRIAVIATGSLQQPSMAAPDTDTSESSAGSVPGPAPSSVPAPESEVERVTAAPVSTPGAPPARQGSDGRFYSPLVRSIAGKEGLSEVDLASIQGSGHGGRITKKDVLRFIAERGTRPATKASAPVNVPSIGGSTPRSSEPKRQVLAPAAPVPPKSPGDRVEVVQMDRMRQLISEHMTRSKATSAHVTSFAEADVTNLVILRERNKEAFHQREGVKLTYTPFFVYAAVEALRDHPFLNAALVDNEIHVKKDYHIGIAVALDTSGLVVPVIRDAGQRNLVGLAHAAADLARRTRNKQLVPDDLQGGTFTVTNVGSLGSIMGTPIINQPQVGILATGAITKRPVVIEDPVMGDTIGVRSMMFVSLSHDHRLVDGAMASSFLARFVTVLRSFDPSEVI